MAIWLQNGPDSDVVVSSRVRLARNYQDIPFPSILTKEQAALVASRAKVALVNSSGDYRYVSLSELHDVERNVLVERHLASFDLLKKPDYSALVVNKNETISVMINEEDHLRIQCLMPGNQLAKAFEIAKEIDICLDKQGTYAFDEAWGYLTACPTNVGTGMRASVMVHLPALSMTSALESMIQVLQKVGLAVRGIYGEGTTAQANLFQISNQATLGMREEDIIKNLTQTVGQIIARERISRNSLRKNKGLALEDRLCRSYGILANARKLDTKEFMKLFSDVKLGVDMGFILVKDISALQSLMIAVQPAGLQKKAGKELSAEERDQMRAEIVRNTLDEIKI